VFNDNKIYIDELKRTASQRSVLFELLTPYSFTPSTIEDIYESIDSISGKIFYSDVNSDLGKKGYRLIKDRNIFLLDALTECNNKDITFLIEEGASEILEPIRLIIRILNSSDEIKYHRNILYLDEEKIKYPLELRRWRAGDWFIPFGMKGRKKLSDYFTDHKFTLKDKAEAWILTSGEDIVWLVGERNDDRFKITDRTKKIVAIEKFN
jgi:tRNA(Ile)-lysidine synthase